MSTLPLNGFLSALESWGVGRASEPPKTWLLIRTPMGGFEMWHGAGLDGRIVAAANQGVHTQLSLSDPGLERHGQTWSREDAAKAFLARTMKAAIGGRDGWHPCYQGFGILTGLGVNRFDAASRFREVAPVVPGPNAAPPAVAEPTFDANDFKARLKARRALEAASAQAAADLKVERDDGVRRVKAFRAPGDTMLADLPVTGLSEGSPPVSGRIHSCNPQYAVVEVVLSDLAQVSGPLTWVFDPKHPFTVGVTAADHK